MKNQNDAIVHSPEPETLPARRRGRAIRLATFAIAAVLVVGCASAWLITQNTAGEATAKPTVDYATAPVTLGSMGESKVLTGSLLYSEQHAITSGVAGVVTTLPEIGASIGRGGALYSVDNRPVLLLHGALPAWRDFGAGMTNGPDVTQLEANLQSLGFFTGDVDEEFTRLTTAGISAWQKALGQERTGTLNLGTVLFSPADVRVAALGSSVGASVGGGSAILTVSSAEKIVQVEVKVGDQSLATVGNAVVLTLPDGTTTEGTVSAAGVAMEKADGEGSPSKSIVIPTTIALADQAAAAAFPLASVQVSFTTSQRQDVLTAPVEALVAIDDTTFGVHAPEKDGSLRMITVTVGIFAAGRVEISGAGIVDGLNVVVPKR